MELAAREVFFFAVRCEDAHLNFMKAWRDSNEKGMAFWRAQHKHFHRQYNKTQAEYDALRKHAK